MNNTHAIVLGGGFSGMLATHLLSQYYKRVTLIERDDLAKGTIRKGIPQANHLHVLLQRGQQLLESILPGILTQLREHELQEIDWAHDVKWYGPFGDYPQYKSSIKTLSFSRVWLDRILGRRIANLKNVTLIKGFVLSLEKKTDRLDTVHYVDDKNKTQSLTGDLIIEARGRSSNANQLLKQLGYPTKSAHIVNNELGYASRVYRAIRKNTHNFKQIYLQVRPSKNTKGVVISPIENEYFILTALGLGIDKPQRNEEHFQNFLKQIPCPELQDFLTTLQPLGNINIYRNLKNCNYWYGDMKKWPPGFIVIGDAACILNPVYGQGMTVATKQVMLLKLTLDSLTNRNKKNWEHDFQKKIDRLNLLPWLLATSEDQRAQPAQQLPIYLRCLHRYFDKILKLAISHKDIHLLFIEVMHMVKSPYQFLHPKLLTRIMFG